MKMHQFGIALIAVTSPSFAQCPENGALVHFGDGSIAMRTGLAVNPDGAVQSYTVGDHGFTYMRNGLNLWKNGSQIGCSKKENAAECRAAIKAVEAGNFGPGTPELCVYAMEVERFAAGLALTSCGSGRFVAGNSKGRIRIGASVPSVTGAMAATYVSTTSLRHKKGGSATYLDSATVPVLVYPTSSTGLRGSVAWVRYQGRTSYAVFGDAGPKFGEGSVALHQLLRTGTLVDQVVGPIPPTLRCGSVEMSIQSPFVIRPDVKNDLCITGKAVGQADIRAYTGISGKVDTVVLKNAKVPMNGSLILEEVTPSMLENIARSAGYDLDRLTKMADCQTAP